MAKSILRNISMDIRMVTTLRKQLEGEKKQVGVKFGKLSGFCYKLCKHVVLGYCVGNTVATLVGFPAFINGASMQPTLNPGSKLGSGWLDMEWVWVNCWRARRYNFARGDLVVYTSPKDPCEYLIKRVIAAEGDTMSTSGRYSQPVVRIPAGHIWVEGDNWGNSVDSNKYGPVSKGLVIGVASHIIWPPTRIQVLESRVPDWLQPNRVARGDKMDMDWSTRSWQQVFKVLLHFIRS